MLAALEADGVSLRPYEGIYDYARRLAQGQTVMLDTRRVSTTLLTSIPTGVTLRDRPNPTELRRAIKNPVEQTNLRQAHLADGIALTRFMYWVKTQAGAPGLTERSALISWRPSAGPIPTTASPALTPSWPPGITAP